MAKRRDDPLNEWVGHLPEQFVICRDLGHQWTPYRAWRDTREREYVQVLRCRCGTERHRTIDYRGNRGSNSYSYPDGYEAPAGSGVMTAAGRADLRLAAIQKFVEQMNESEQSSVVELRERRRKRAS